MTLIKKILTMFTSTAETQNKFPNCEKPFYALVITDTHGHIKGLSDFVKDKTIDVILTLGDIEYRDFEVINELFSSIPKYGIIGNHDYFNVLKDNNVTSIHGRAIDVNGIIFAGIYGSQRYKSMTAPMHTDEESIRIAELMPGCEVLLTHDKAKIKDVDEKQLAHGGLKGIAHYLKLWKPKYHLHGHLHENMNEKIYNVPSYGFCRFAYLEFSKEGIKVMDTFPKEKGTVFT